MFRQRHELFMGRSSYPLAESQNRGVTWYISRQECADYFLAGKFQDVLCSWVRDNMIYFGGFKIFSRLFWG